MTQQLIRPEAERQFYLGVAGIRMWYAREPLPGAAPSPEFDFGSLEAAVEPQVSSAIPVADRRAQSRAATDDGKKDKLARLKTLMDAVPDKPSVRKEVPAVVPVPDNTAPKPDDAAIEDDSEHTVVPSDIKSHAPRLYLQSWSGKRILLAANLSEDASLSLQETLALNVLRSLGELSPVKSRALHWPLFNNLKVSLNSDADLSMLVRDYLSEAKDKVVVVLGISSEASVFASMVANTLEKPPEVSADYSLAALASDPELKKQLWQLIRPLVDGYR